MKRHQWNGFPGAVDTLCIEAMMQDRKALQAGTSHYLGQNFSKVFGIRYLDQGGELQFAHTTSWGVSTRLVGGVIMTHSDDDGLRLPPLVAPKQVVVLPVIPGDEHIDAVMNYADEIAKSLGELSFCGERIQVTVDRRDIRGAEKNWQWIKKGIPIRIEAGPRDIEKGQVVLLRRDQSHRDKQFMMRRAFRFSRLNSRGDAGKLS